MVRGRADHYGRSILVYIGNGGARGVIKSTGSRVGDGSVFPVELPAQSPIGALAHFSINLAGARSSKRKEMARSWRVERPVKRGGGATSREGINNFFIWFIRRRRRPTPSQTACPVRWTCCGVFGPLKATGVLVIVPSAHSARSVAPRTPPCFVFVSFIEIPAEWPSRFQRSRDGLVFLFRHFC